MSYTQCNDKIKALKKVSVRDKLCWIKWVKSSKHSLGRVGRSYGSFVPEFRRAFPPHKTPLNRISSIECLWCTLVPRMYHFKLFEWCVEDVVVPHSRDLSTGSGETRSPIMDLTAPTGTFRTWENFEWWPILFNFSLFSTDSETTFTI